MLPVDCSKIRASVGERWVRVGSGGEKKFELGRRHISEKNLPACSAIRLPLRSTRHALPEPVPLLISSVSVCCEYKGMRLRCGLRWC